MKVLLKIFATALLCQTFIGCATSDFMDGENTNDATVMVKVSSEMGQMEFWQQCAAISADFGSRAEMNDYTCKEMLKPLINDGAALQRQIVLDISDKPELLDEKQFYMSLSDDELATLSMLYHVLSDDGVDIDKLNEDIDGLRISRERLLACLEFAVGITELKELTVRGVVNAVTIRKALSAIGRRYIGYVGVALMIYDFMDCVG